MQKITPSLWFDKEAEEAMKFYIDIFNSAPNKKAESKIVGITRYPDDQQVGPMKDMGGKVLNGIFELAGQRFICLDGGPIFKFNESISLYVEVADQEELDYYWNALSAVKESEQCGWLKDKFGLSWQIIPARMGELLGDPDKEKAGRAMQAMLQMHKIDIAALEKAYKGE
ncbi:MAG TPA: VOC family protein [Verrucomicrobiae bacterium]|nr:VOC family protein [Verrucomicrobiae bacterium]